VNVSGSRPILQSDAPSKDRTFGRLSPFDAMLDRRSARNEPDGDFRLSYAHRETAHEPRCWPADAQEAEAIMTGIRRMAGGLLTLCRAAGAAQAQTAPMSTPPVSPFTGGPVPAATLGIANPGGLGSAASGSVGAAFTDETVRTGELINRGGLSFGGGGGSFGVVAVPGTSLTPDVEAGLTTGRLGFTGVGISTGSNAPGLSRLESPGIGTAGGGAPTRAGMAGTPGSIDADTDPFDGRGTR
jgi:hypothetical protein